MGNLPQLLSGGFAEGVHVKEDLDEQEEVISPGRQVETQASVPVLTAHEEPGLRQESPHLRKKPLSVHELNINILLYKGEYSVSAAGSAQVCWSVTRRTTYKQPSLRSMDAR